MIVVGDAKLSLLVAIIREYGEELNWLLPYPGDWHILLNYQKVLMKPYIDAGLLSLAKVGGHRGETLTSIANASNFKRTHRFLLQAYEPFYLFFLSLIMDHKSEQSLQTSQCEIKQILHTLSLNLASLENSEYSLEKFRASAHVKLSSTFQSMMLLTIPLRLVWKAYH